MSSAWGDDDGEARRSELWVLGATFEQLKGLLARACERLPQPENAFAWLPGRLAQYPHATQLLVVQHDDGLVHLVAQLAVADGFSCLTIDADAFSSRTAFAFLVEHVPSSGVKSAWFDPIRGLDDSQQVTEWLGKYVHPGLTCRDWALEQYRLPPHLAVSPFSLWDSKRKRWAPQWPESRAAEASASSSNITHTLTFVGLLVLGLMMGSVFTAMGQPRGLADALGVIPYNLLLAGWLCFVPVRWPNGRPVSFALRLLYFVGVPVVGPFVSLVFS